MSKKTKKLSVVELLRRDYLLAHSRSMVASSTLAAAEAVEVSNFTAATEQLFVALFWNDEVERLEDEIRLNPVHAPTRAGDNALYWALRDCAEGVYAMKTKTQDLSGAALDWAVAKCEEMSGSLVFGRGDVRAMGYCVCRPNGTRLFYVLRKVWDEWVGKCETHPWGTEVSIWSPSTNWSQGGPIIERENISIGKADDPDWWAFKGWRDEHGLPGPTPLIAAMRCYVTSKLGDEVDVPEELT